MREHLGPAVFGICAAVVFLAISLLSGCGDPRATKHDAAPLNAKTFWAERERWSGGSDGGGP